MHSNEDTVQPKIKMNEVFYKQYLGYAYALAVLYKLQNYLDKFLENNKIKQQQQQLEILTEIAKNL